MNLNEILAITVVLAAVFAYINHRWIKWSTTIGIMVLCSFQKKIKAQHQLIALLVLFAIFTFT